MYYKRKSPRTGFDKRKETQRIQIRLSKGAVPFGLFGVQVGYDKVKSGEYLAKRFHRKVTVRASNRNPN